MRATKEYCLRFLILGILLFCCETKAKRDSDDFATFNLVRSARDLGSLDGIQSEQNQLDGFANPTNPSSTSTANQNRSSGGDVFQLLLPEGYNMHQIPKHSSGRPMEVMIQMNIRKILNFDEPGESLKTDVEFRVFWTDYKIRDYINSKKAEKGFKRVSFDELTPEERKKMTVTLNDPHILDIIWKPNLFFGNLLKVTQPYAMAKPVTLKFIPDIGAFEYLLRISVTTDCPMDFHYYPADTQECHFSIRAFSYPSTDLKLNWYKTGVWLHELQTSSFDVKVADLDKHLKIIDDEDPLSDYFEVYTFRIQSRRRLSYHVVQTFLPSTFYIIITCLCFLLPSRYVEARIGIAMTTLLTLTAMFASVRESTPQVSYVKAIDTWMAGCIMFVFLTLAEFTFITWLRSVKEDHLAAKEEQKAGSDGDGVEMDVFVTNNRKESFTVGRMSPKSIKRYENLMTFLEKYNFPIFISILAVYSLIYWTWLISSADYFDWDIDEAYNNVHGDPW